MTETTTARPEPPETRFLRAARTYVDGKVTLDADIFDDMWELVAARADTGSERESGLDADTTTPPDRLSVIRDAIDRFTGRRRYQISEDDIDDLAVEIDGLLPATPDPSIPERPDLDDARSYREVIEDVTPESLRLLTPDEAVAVITLARAALGSIPERPAEPLRPAAAALDRHFALLIETGQMCDGLCEPARNFRAALAQQSTPESRDE